MTITHCEKCGYQKPDVKYAVDVKLHLCNECWANTPPPEPKK